MDRIASFDGRVRMDGTEMTELYQLIILRGAEQDGRRDARPVRPGDLFSAWSAHSARKFIPDPIAALPSR